MFARKDGTTWQEKRWILRTDAQRVEKGAARYLAKYLSKMRSKSFSQIAFPPSAWWFASANLRRAAQSVRWTFEVAEITPITAHDLYEQISARICESATVAYPLSYQYDISYKGVIAMMPPVIAGMQMREITPLLRVLQSGHQIVTGLEKFRLNAVRALFEGQWLSTA
jgi:hypothetical protein